MQGSARERERKPERMEKEKMELEFIEENESLRENELMELKEKKVELEERKVTRVSCAISVSSAVSVTRASHEPCAVSAAQ